jgi:hypothetical protein
MATRSSRAVRLGLLAAFAMTLGACSASPALSTAPTIAAQPTVLATPTATSSPMPSATTGPIAEGRYRSQTVSVAVIIAEVNSDRTLTAPEKAYAIEQQGFADHKTRAVEMNFRNGQLTVTESFDGGPFNVGARATYAFPDSHTLVIQETCCGISTFDLTPGANSFTLKYRAGAPNAGEDIVGQTVYELSPFTLEP